MMPLALFDLDDTLVDRHAAFLRWADEFAAAHGLDEKALTFMVMADAHHSGPMDGYFAVIGSEFGLADPPAELWAQYRRRMPELASCSASDVAALTALRAAGWRIGIVTNGMADNQSAKIVNTGLAELVDGWAISGEVGIRKPDPEIFRIAAARCGTSLDHSDWMIGDHLLLDIAGGQAAGLRTIWLTPDQSPPTDLSPTHTATSVSAAVDLLLRRR